MASVVRRLAGLLRSSAGSARDRDGRAANPTEQRVSEQRVEYTPEADGRADPGEVVWAWVPYEDDPSRGKDRPVLVVGRDAGQLLALMMTSQDHDRDAADEARYGRVWMDVGSGAWDAQRRPSEVRLDRVLTLDESGVRREGARLDRGAFDPVAAELRRMHGWT